MGGPPPNHQWYTVWFKSMNPRLFRKSILSIFSGSIWATDKPITLFAYSFQELSNEAIIFFSIWVWLSYLFLIWTDLYYQLLVLSVLVCLLKTISLFPVEKGNSCVFIKKDSHGILLYFEASIASRVKLYIIRHFVFHCSIY